MNNLLKQVSFWIMLLIIMVLAWSQFSAPQKTRETLRESDFLPAIDSGTVKNVTYRSVATNMLEFTVKCDPAYKGNTIWKFRVGYNPPELMIWSKTFVPKAGNP